MFFSKDDSKAKNKLTTHLHYYKFVNNFHNTSKQCVKGFLLFRYRESTTSKLLFPNTSSICQDMLEMIASQMKHKFPIEFLAPMSTQGFEKLYFSFLF